jgi:CubicO group peptidase (beta-lactamase class C family)
MYASARDWLAWSRFLKRSMVEEATLFDRYTKPDLEDYGSGIGNKLLEAVDGSRVRVYSHSGGDPGHYGYFAFFPETDVTLVVLANADYASLGNYEIGDALRDLLAGLPYERVK